MKAYIQVDNEGEYKNESSYKASVGFNLLGFEVIKFSDINAIQDDDTSAVIIGGIGTVHKRLEILGLHKAHGEDYPQELQPFLNRNVWQSTLQNVIAEQRTHIFIKPLQNKLFTGKVIYEFKDFIGLNYADTVDVWCSDVVEMIAEWRCFVRYKEIVDVRHYKGQWNQALDVDIVQQAIDAFTTQPHAYCLDFGIDKNGTYYLVEINEGHSVGCYGMGEINYARFLYARWCEMTNNIDHLRF